jgi:hypothetical protein
VPCAACMACYREPFPSWLCLAGLQNVDGFGELAGAPGQLRSLRRILQVLSCAFALSPGERSFACALLAFFLDSGLFFPLGVRVDLRQAQDDIATLRQDVNNQARASSLSILSIGGDPYRLVSTIRAFTEKVNSDQASGPDTPWQGAADVDNL